MFRNTSSFPPGGWQYVQRETGWNAPSGCTFDTLVKRVVSYRLSNPGLGVSANPKRVGIDIQIQNGARIGFLDHYWSGSQVEPEPTKPTVKSTRSAAYVGMKVDSALDRDFKPSKERLLVVFPFCYRDWNQAEAVLEWIQQLGGCRDNDALLVADIKVPQSDLERLSESASRSFKSVSILKTPKALNREGWPLGPNWMFENTLRKVKRPFLWMEPDCIPLRPGWLRDLESEYHSCGKPFMGCKVHSSGRADNKPDHVTGCAVYPGNAHQYLQGIYGSSAAFDMAMAPIVMPRAHHTKLHHHFWRNTDWSPSGDARRDKELLAKIPVECALLHRCKDGSLIKLLKATRL